jgi:RelA/SpoT family (p)ppGpp synthetase
VARILAEMRIDHRSIVAAILHDVIEDTPVRKQQITDSFGEEVADLVDGVSKLTHIEFESKAEAQAENFRKMMLAMTQDIRIILIKLADRLHNMRTLASMRPDKRRRIARETLDIYAPIANRLGINKMRIELEDLGFAAYYPMRHRTLADALKKARGNRKEVVEKIQSAMRERLAQEKVPARVIGREKHIYSIYKKMKSKNVSFNEVMDVFAFRIVVDKVDTCYRTLGVMHNLYKPIPGRFKDYIAIPKANGYQSLHSALVSPFGGFPIEVQIRTEEMDKVAEAGIAAHWLYKVGDSGGHSIAQARAREWLRDLLEMQRSAGDSLEFLENVRVDLFPDEVYVFTPKGEIMKLPRGATVVDFAYAVHSGLGNACVAGKVDQRLVPLNTRLENGQKVEIITAPGARPHPTWLNFVNTGKARGAIRSYLKNLHRDESVALGRRMLNKVLGTVGTKLEKVPPERIKALLSEYKRATVEDLLEDIGLGKRMATLVATALQKDAAPRTNGNGEPLSIQGTEGTVVNFAKCCRPIPGDAIQGFMTMGRGIVVHQQNCRNVSEFRKQPERWIDVQWEQGVKGEFPVDIRVDVNNKRGVLAEVAAACADGGANIDSVNLEDRDGVHTAISLTISVRDRKHLARIMRRVRVLDDVLRISRVRG